MQHEAYHAYGQFQSTLPQGERQSKYDERIISRLFQSTLPQGERPGGQSVTRIGMTFQSTLPQGERQSEVALLKTIPIFQSTLPQGERRRTSWQRLSQSRYFNPRSHKGSDGVSTIDRNAKENFNPRSHKGSDSVVQWLERRGTKFQSTLPQGERHSK